MSLQTALNHRKWVEEELAEAQKVLRTEIRLTRLRLGFGFREMGAALGVSSSTAWQIERGLTVASPDLVQTMIRLEDEAAYAALVAAGELAAAEDHAVDAGSQPVKPQ
jgi:transcriptional regulator with XRE-family HTH domain